MTCIIDQTKDATKLICWARGDSDARGFIVQNDAGVAIDITGFTFRLTVNTEKDPAPGTELFTVVGSITDAPAGQVAFAPTSGQTDQTPGTYFYDIEQTDVGGLISTLIKGKCQILQDISK